MEKFISQKSGFTLIELLVVMAILGLLVVMGLGGYNSYRRAAMLNLSVDNFAAQMKEMKEMALLGDVGRDEQQKAKCYGLYYRQGEGFYRVVMEYDTVKEWRNDLGDFAMKGCDPTVMVAGGSLEKMSMDEEFGVQEVLATRTGNVEEMMVYFEPPKGTKKYWRVFEDEGIVVKFYYGSEFSEDYSKVFYLN